MTRIKTVIFNIILMGLSIQPLYAQESIIKEIIEPQRDKKYALYPSTLRMINIQQNKDYNDLVSGIEKLLIYTLDSSGIAKKSHHYLINAYIDADFEEYVMAFGGDMNLALLGKTGRDNQFVGYTKIEHLTVAFYLRGNIAWQKIPGLLRNIQNGDFMNIIQLTN